MTEKSATETPNPDQDTSAATADTQPARSGAAANKPLWIRLFGHDLSALLFLLVLALVMFVPGQWTVPPLDRDEPRYTQATKQMLETGDYVDIRFQDEARHKKPVGIYWLQAVAAKTIGSGEQSPLWVYRLPSLISAVLAVLAGFWLARAFMGPAGALLVGSFLAAAIILGVEARLAKTDAALLLTILLAQGALARIWLTHGESRLWGLSFVLWTSLAASILIKGPVGPMVVGFTVAGLMLLGRSWRWVKSATPVLGLVWMLALASPWFIAIGLATDGAFFAEAIGRDLIGKIGEGQESHGAPPLTHLAAMFAVFWPLPAFALLAAPAIWRERKSPLVVFAAAWFVPTWVVFEMVATKLPHYTMPILPALALAVSAALVDGAGTAGSKGLRRIAAVVLAVPVVGVAIAAFAGPFVLGVWPSPPGAVLSAIAAVLALAASSQILRELPMKAVATSLAAGAFMMVGFWGFVGPALTPIWVSPRLAAAIDAVPDCPDPQVAIRGFHEPSFIFLQGTGTRILYHAEAVKFLQEGLDAGVCRIAAIESREKAAFLEAAEAAGLETRTAGNVQGLNINGGDQVDIGLYLAQPTNASRQGGQ
ncbi:glycosyl transferase [Roseibium aquae]|uniref:Glycosyl transferase n=1 Tax=Roseibium aquae TaxID=1323746 RepID=A0A916TGF1_9HYPH|nr:glycosyltransferase family 39 protein [Roseibium aquae]GGB44493.1 glycosyl transferase [Roseibium aquae]